MRILNLNCIKKVLILRFSYNHIAERVIFVTGDSDFIPAIKTARRNGIFVYLVTLNHMVRSELPDNCDVCNSDGIKSYIV